MRDQRRFGLIIIGGGPGGLAPLLAAHHFATIDELFDHGVAIVEQSGQLGCGTLGNYAINSDSSGATFVDCLRSPLHTRLSEVAAHPLGRLMAAAGEGAVALRDAGTFLKVVGDALGEMIEAHPACKLFTHHRAISVTRMSAGWRVVVSQPDGSEATLIARNVVLATGAHQPQHRLATETVAGESLRDYCGLRLLQSGDVLGNGGLEMMATALADITDPRVAVVGGSTSAAAVAHALLHRLPSVHFNTGGVTLLHRRELRIYYPDVVSALSEGYTEFTEQDICPISGRVFRFAGFRLDSRELIMQARGIGNRRPEPRLHLHQVMAEDPKALRILDRAHLVVAALGYRPKALPVLDQANDPIPLLAQTGPQEPLVDGRCRVLDAEGAPLPGLFGIGLAAGFQPRGVLGGEPSFRGQANGLWLWQHDVGNIIVEAVLSPEVPVHGPIAAAGVLQASLVEGG